MSKPIYENEKYEVQSTSDALGEDGRYGRGGYAVINKETGVTEHTTMVLPQALFQADAFMGALGQLNKADDEEIVGSTSDVVDIDPTMN